MQVEVYPLNSQCDQLWDPDKCAVFPGMPQVTQKVEWRK